MVTVVQIIGAIGIMSISWGEPLTSLLDAMKIFVFNIEILRVGCVMNPSPFALFAIKVVTVVVLIMLTFVVHIFHVLILYLSPAWTYF